MASFGFTRIAGRHTLIINSAADNVKFITCVQKNKEAIFTIF